MLAIPNYARIAKFTVFAVYVDVVAGRWPQRNWSQTRQEEGEEEALRQCYNGGVLGAIHVCVEHLGHYRLTLVEYDTLVFITQYHIMITPFQHVHVHNLRDIIMKVVWGISSRGGHLEVELPCISS